MSNKIVERALNSLGKGFDLTSDFRLKYCKGKDRLVVLNETGSRELVIPGFGSFQDVSMDIKCDKGERTRYQSDILDFNQMSEFFNQRSSVTGKIPSGQFNSMFGFQSGSWATDAASTKYLGLDGYFIMLFNVHIERYPLILSDEVRNAVPSTWDPPALARFIEKYGTHIIVGLSLGGQDVLLVRQDKSSNLEPSKIKNHLDNLGDQLFNGACSFSPRHFKTRDQHKQKAPSAFNVFDPQPALFNGFSFTTSKDGISVICSKKGGDLSANTHCEWLPTVTSMPDAVQFNFIPITSLLKGVQGKGFLSHAINLYLRSQKLGQELDGWLRESGLPKSPDVQGVIAPHAGYSYSGRAAAFAFANIDPSNIARVFLLGPSHHHYTPKCALTRATIYKTPIGDLPIDLEVNEELKATGKFDLMDLRVDEAEHSMETHLPYIAKVFKGSYFRLQLMEISRLGYMTMWDLELIMMLLGTGVLLCCIVLTEVDCSLAERVKKGSLIWLNGMRVKGPYKEDIFWVKKEIGWCCASNGLLLLRTSMRWGKMRWVSIRIIVSMVI